MNKIVFVLVILAMMLSACSTPNRATRLTRSITAPLPFVGDMVDGLLPADPEPASAMQGAGDESEATSKTRQAILDALDREVSLAAH